MNRLKKFREARGLSQERLAELVRPKTSQPQIGRLEKDPDDPNYRKMTIAWAQRLAPHLGCKPLDLLPLSDNEENLPKKPNVKDSVTKPSYSESADDKETDQEGKDVEVPDTVLAAIGRLTIENEKLKAELRKVRSPQGEPNPRKARGK